MRFWLAFIVNAGLMLCSAARSQAQGISRSASEPFLIDHNRIFAELNFIRPDRSIRKTLAFVDSGDPSFEFTSSLAKELGRRRLIT